MCVFGSSKITAEIESNSGVVPAGKTKFTNLNIDVLHLIYDQLNLESLMCMKGTRNKLLASFTDEYFCHKFSRGMVILKPLAYKYTISYDTHIELSENAFSLEFLQHFGNCIRSIYFDFEKSKEILPNITSPLIGVKKFISYIDINQTEFDVMPLNLLVPNVKILELNLDFENDYSFLDCELQQLIKLDLKFKNRFWNQTDAIDKLIRKNPQIRDINIWNLPGDYAKFISKSLPHLSTLFISNFDIDIDELRFENVQKFTLFESNPHSIMNLYMPRIEYLWFRCYTPESFDALNTFFRNHKQLKRLYLGDFNDFDRLTELTTELVNLTELRLQCNFDVRNYVVDLEEIARLLKHQPNIIKLELNFYGSIEIDVFRKRFENEWNIDYNGSFQITMLQKNSTMALR